VPLTILNRYRREGRER